MNLHKAWQQRDQLNEKMTRLLLQGLQEQRVNYLAAIANYPPDRMAQYGQPHLLMIEQKIQAVQQLIASKFT